MYIAARLCHVDTRRLSSARLGVFTLLGALIGFSAASAFAQLKQAISVEGVECSKIYELGIDKQENLRATYIRVGCGLEPAGEIGAEFEGALESADGAGISNVNTITGAETWPKVTQSESMVWSNPEGTTIVVNYNDSASSPGNYSGVSVSTDSGATFTRLLPPPFANGHGTNFGDPIVVFNVALNRWFAGDLATGCGGQGIGLWTSPDGVNWTVGACAHNGSFDDRETMWVDNNAASPFFGRMYIAWNDFGAGQRIYATHSDDGTTWSAPVALSTGFIRTVQLTGSPSDGMVFLAAMDEGGGGISNRRNILYRSNNGGVSWTEISMGPAFPAAGTASCGFFAAIPPLWRHMGWGQPTVGPDQVVHYVYTGRGVNAGDIGDVYYIRSTDNGDTWSTPTVLNSDAATGGNHSQWMPSMSTTSDGKIQVTWYDRRNSSGNDYQYFGIQSLDNGVSWGDDFPVSDVTPIPQPEQPDSAMVGCYAGDYNYQSTNDQTAFVTWTDGRNLITGHSQQDVYFAGIPFVVSGGILEGQVIADTGDPIAGARVQATGMVQRSRVTDSAGNYRLRVPADTYSVTASAFGYLSRTVEGVGVVEGQTTTQNFSLTAAPAHRLSGTVFVASTGVPLPNVEVRILNTPIPPTRTDDTGAYVFAAVPDGSYSVQAGASGRCLGALTQAVDIVSDTSLDFPVQVRVDAFGYACDDGIPFNWIVADHLLALVGDDASEAVPLPFPFRFYGQTYSVLHVSTNGFGNFLAPDSTFSNRCIPDPAPPNAYLGPLWTDLLVNRPSGVYTMLLGEVGARQFIIEWRDVTFFGQPGTATFEIILNEADNSIVYQYNRADIFGDGRSATIGIENQTGTVGTQYSCREAVVGVGKAVRFYLAQ